MSELERLNSLWSKLKKDKNLSHKLNLLEEISLEDNSCSGKVPTSPIKTRKVVMSQYGTFKEIDPVNIVQETPNEVGQVNDTPTVGAPNTNLENNSDSAALLGELERGLCEDEDKQEDESEKGTDSDSDSEFQFLGATPSPSWAPSKKAMNLFLKVADLELKKEILNDLHEEFKADPEIDSHFTPPKFPSSIWSLVQNSTSDTSKLSTLFKCQDNLCLALKPLLSCLDSAPKECHENITKAIQLITSTNLNLNRFRRVTIAPHLKPELRKQIFALPVLHDSFFGEDFSKASDNIVKEQSALDKLLKKPSFKNNNFSVKNSTY